MKIATIIAFKNFKDEEYFIPRRIFDQAGAKVKVISNELGMAQGTDGGEEKTNIKLSDFNVSDFDAIVFVGGPGALECLDNHDSYRIAKEAIEQNKVLAAICISPTILAKAGVLREKKATVWTGSMNKEPQKTLEENGAIYQDAPVVQDNNIITANGPAAAEEFGKKIIETLR